ncbi:MAG: MerR family transcriptional regulator [Alistipes sp.]|nr:MerR family transcriptional regulator [Alistipes sp.]
MAEKIFYSMGEVAEMFDVKTSLIRHWETQFSVLKPKRNKKGNRLFSPEDVENLKVIYHLVKERGMTLEGAKRAMKRRAANGDEIRREAELMTRLKHIRTLLLEVREDLKTGGEGIVDEDKEPIETDAPQAEEERIAKPEPEEPKEPEEEDRPAEPEEDMQFTEPEREDIQFTEPQPEEERFMEPAEEGRFLEPLPEEEPEREMQVVEVLDDTDWEEEPAAESGWEEPGTEEAAAEAKPRTPGRRGRRKSDDDDKELFAFYEQSLF